MKLASYRTEGRESFGVVAGDGMVDLRPIQDEVGATLREALERDALARIRSWSQGRKADRPLAGLEFLPVVTNPSKIICIGINYRSHVQETGREMPTKPMIFTRFADSQTGHEQPLVRPRVSEKLDFEGELAVIIGKHVTTREGRRRARLRRRLFRVQRRQRARLAAPHDPVHAGQELPAHRRLRAVARHHRRDSRSLGADAASRGSTARSCRTRAPTT